MSARRDENAVAEMRRSTPVFAALGDETRLTLVMKLSGGSRCSIAHLTEGLTVTRQAITKHLRVLQGAGLVRGVRRGREKLFELEPKRLGEAQRALDHISKKWDEALARLKSFVEK
ncbi:MAG TPA: metalloregulator ArsR/SmtB family transcription factor [Tepidisphaeraceae bacterium]|jgi:DNA-binding transcriptional ArsR family regulator|nr:metalloregulator ArsR/SmtB family transcription factor [Tepidisphaeraceae bacterium]